MLVSNDSEATLLLGSVRIGRDHLAERPGRQRPPGDRVDRRLEEVDRAVGEEHVRPAGVQAPVVLDVGLGVVDRADAVLQPAGPMIWVQHSSGEGLNWSVPPSIGDVLPSQPSIERATQVT